MPTPPDKYIKKGLGLVRNPEYDVYMKANRQHQETSGGNIQETDHDEQHDEQQEEALHTNEPKDIDSDGDTVPPKYIQQRGKMVLNPDYVVYHKGTPSLSRSAVRTKLDALTDLCDLSRDWECADPERPRRTLRCNPGARWIEATFGAMTEVRRVSVIERGKLVADYRQEGVGPDDTFNLFSTTKGILSLLIGVCIDKTDLTVHDTLEQVFQNNPIAWSRLEDSPEELAYTKSVTILELLTMTSGLVSVVGGVKGVLSMTEWSVADAAGSDLPRALAAPGYNPKLRGQFHYMPSSNILSYVLKEKTGLSPLEFAQLHVFSKLGIRPSQMHWDTNADGIETSYSQLHLTTLQMCKIGQLYLQDGFVGPNALRPVFGDDWIAASHRKHVYGQGGFDHWYGYLWSLYDRDFHSNHQAGDIWCAPGFNGQVIAIARDTQRVMAISRSPFPPLGGEALIDYKKCCIKLLGKTMSYQPLESLPSSECSSSSIPPNKFVRKEGKMVRNPDYDEYMKNVHQRSLVLPPSTKSTPGDERLFHSQT